MVYGFLRFFYGFKDVFFYCFLFSFNVSLFFFLCFVKVCLMVFSGLSMVLKVFFYICLRFFYVCSKF